MYPSQPYLGRMGVCQGLYERKIKHVEFTQLYVMIICLSWVHTKNWNEVFSCWVQKKKCFCVVWKLATLYDGKRGMKMMKDGLTIYRGRKKKPEILCYEC